jgi:hypothetical protein
MALDSAIGITGILTDSTATADSEGSGIINSRIVGFVETSPSRGGAADSGAAVSANARRRLQLAGSANALRLLPLAVSAVRAGVAGVWAGTDEVAWGEPAEKPLIFANLR